MNFADALRAAKHKAGETVLPEGAHFHASVPAIAQGQLPPVHVYQPTHEPKPVPKKEPKPKAQEAPKIMANNPSHNETPAAIGNVVRLELFLTPEQLSGLFRAVVAAQHSVMTMREAANHLRVAAHVLEELAREGEIPAFLVEGKWRFPRNGLDEWMNMQTTKKEAS